MDTNNFEEQITLLKKFDEAYFNDDPIVPDVQYDSLKKSLLEINPEHPYFKSIGSDVRGGKINLPYTMGSLDQIYEGDYSNWIKKYNLHSQEIVISEKLDGVSIMLVYEYGKLKIAYSRGNGIQGADITRHIRQIPSVPKNIKDNAFLVVRAEGIMKNNIFDAKYSKKYRNARQMVAGCMNRKETDPSMLSDISIVAYELVDSSIDKTFNKRESLEFLRDNKFLIAYYELDTGDAHSDESLKTVLDRFKNSSSYELDGIVLTVNDYLKVSALSKRDSLNPEHSVKFKTLSEDSIVEAEVVRVHWKLSKSGYWKPRVEIKPVELFGTTVTFATGFNGKFINDNEIGTGTIIKITKSGSVIPYILDVIKPTNADLPDDGTWEWNDNRVEIVGVGTDSESNIMQAVHFFKTIEVDQLKETSLRKVIEKYANDRSFEEIIFTLFDLFEKEWVKVLGQNGSKIYSSLHNNLRNLSPAKLLGATPFFGQGFGVRKAKKIMKEMTLEQFTESSPEDIELIEGFDKTSKVIFDGIDRFVIFLDKIRPYVIFEEAISSGNVSNKLLDKVVVFTGFRDKELQEMIENSGGRVSSAVSGKTSIVVAIDPNEKSSKIKKAKELNIEILSKDEFLDMYL